MRFIYRTGLFVIALAATPMHAVDVDTTKSETASKTLKSDTMRAYVSELYAIDQAEVKMGELAQQHAQNTKTKDLAKMLVTDHQADEKKVKELADKKGLSLDTSEAKMKTKTLDASLEEMKKWPAASFDKNFAQAAVGGHEDAIGIVNNALKTEDDADFKAYLQNLLPVLNKHLDMAKQLQTSMAH